MFVKEIEKEEIKSSNDETSSKETSVEENNILPASDENLDAAQTQEESPVEEKKEELSYENFVKILQQYFVALRDSIRLAKTKDDVISKMKNELMKYREDFSYSLLKPIITNLISFREDSKNTLRNIDKFSSDVESSKKYLGYLNDDFVDMLSIFGIKIEEDKFLLDGIDLNDVKMHKVSNHCVTEEVLEDSISEQEEAATTDCGEEKVYSLNDVVVLVEQNKTNIENILKDNAILDQNFKEVEAIAASVDENYADAILLPAYKELTRFYSKLKVLIERTCENMTDENKTALYQDVMVYVISTVTEILVHLGVEIDVDITNNYDMKTNRMLKFITTDNPELDKTVAFRHTDTYFYNGKPIYLCKVDVYKYEQQK